MSAPVAHDDIFALLQIARFGACATRSDGTVVFWNRRAEQIAGVPSSQALGRHYQDVIAPGPPLPPGGPDNPQAADGPQAAAPAPVLLAGQAGEPLTVYIFDDDRSPHPPSPAAALNTAPGPPTAGGGPGAAAGAAGDLLTGRESQVLQMTALGAATDQIATDLGISVHTVRNHVRNLRRKLDARTKPEAIANAFRRGLL